MKIKLLLILAVFLPLSIFNMNADENETDVKRIPLKVEQGSKNFRNLITIPLESTYYGILSCIQTIALSDIGEISVTVTNYSTGESWYESFDSSVQTQSVIYISGETGFYEISYMTSLGDIYKGTFIL